MCSGTRAPRHGAGRHAALPRRQPGLRPDVGPRLLLRLRQPPQIERGRFQPHRRRNEKNREGRRALRTVRPRPGRSREFCEGLRQKLKVEHIDTGLAEHPTVSFYRQGEFVDLCRGPHIPDAGRIKAFKLLSVAGSYWKGNADNAQLQRLYGTAFFKKDELEAYLKQVEEAKHRDHRVLGKKLGLFTITNEVGQGLCLWMPKGAIVRSLLEDFIKRELLSRGYQPVYTPHVGRVEMYETSGHFPYYRDAQFMPMFGHNAGQLVDFWVRSLTAGSLTPDEEEKTRRGRRRDGGRPWRLHFRRRPARENRNPPPLGARPGATTCSSR